MAGGETGGLKLDNSFRMGEWAKDKREVWHRIVEKYGGDKDAFEWGTWSFFDWATGKSWPTVSSMSKARRYGWYRYDDSYESFAETFRAFENAGVLPPLPRLHDVGAPLNGSTAKEVTNGLSKVDSVVSKTPAVATTESA